MQYWMFIIFRALARLSLCLSVAVLLAYAALIMMTDGNMIVAIVLVVIAVAIAFDQIETYVSRTRTAVIVDIPMARPVATPAYVAPEHREPFPVMRHYGKEFDMFSANPCSPVNA